MKGLDKALSDDYLNRNILALNSYRNSFAIQNSKIEAVLDAWRKNPTISIANEIKKYDMTLVYPILLIYKGNVNNYDATIKKTVEYINSKHSSRGFSLSINFQLFFILLPLSEVKKIKQDVIQWIESKRPLLS